MKWTFQFQLAFYSDWKLGFRKISHLRKLILSVDRSALKFKGLGKRGSRPEEEAKTEKKTSNCHGPDNSRVGDIPGPSNICQLG
jgi:hypothetical protein